MTDKNLNEQLDNLYDELSNVASLTTEDRNKEKEIVLSKYPKEVVDEYKNDLNGLKKDIVQFNKQRKIKKVIIITLILIIIIVLFIIARFLDEKYKYISFIDELVNYNTNININQNIFTEKFINVISDNNEAIRINNASCSDCLSSTYTAGLTPTLKGTFTKGSKINLNIESNMELKHSDKNDIILQINEDNINTLEPNNYSLGIDKNNLKINYIPQNTNAKSIKLFIKLYSKKENIKANNSILEVLLFSSQFTNISTSNYSIIKFSGLGNPQNAKIINYSTLKNNRITATMSEIVPNCSLSGSPDNVVVSSDKNIVSITMPANLPLEYYGMCLKCDEAILLIDYYAKNLSNFNFTDLLFVKFGEGKVVVNDKNEKEFIINNVPVNMPNHIILSTNGITPACFGSMIGMVVANSNIGNNIELYVPPQTENTSFVIGCTENGQSVNLKIIYNLIK